MINEIKKSIISGILISIGCIGYLASISSGLNWLGALLFSAGLFTVCVYEFNLYTGKVGYIGFRFTDFKYTLFVVQICVFNLLTTFLIGMIVGKNFPVIQEQAIRCYSAKLSGTVLKSFISAILCGILMFLSVDSWKKNQKIGLFIYVPLFIIAGFDHSIANSFYNGAAFGKDTFSLANFIFVLTVVLGNAVGGMLIPVLTRSWKK